MPEMMTVSPSITQRFANDTGRQRGVPIFVAGETECADDEEDADEPLLCRAAYSTLHERMAQLEPRRRLGSQGRGSMGLGM
jgi:hypothetical protein